MTQLPSFICLPQPPLWGIVFSRDVWPVVALVVGSVSAISLAFCISCLESPRCLLKPYLNMKNHKNPPNLKDKKKKKISGRAKHISAVIIFHTSLQDLEFGEKQIVEH